MSIEELVARKQKADAMPAAKEQYRAEYDKICAELFNLLVERGGLPLELLNISDNLAITVAALSALSHEIIAGTAGREQYADWVRLWHSLVVFEEV